MSYNGDNICASSASTKIRTTKCRASSNKGLQSRGADTALQLHTITQQAQYTLQTLGCRRPRPVFAAQQALLEHFVEKSELVREPGAGHGRSFDVAQRDAEETGVDAEGGGGEEGAWDVKDVEVGGPQVDAEGGDAEYGVERDAECCENGVQGKIGLQFRPDRREG